MNENQQIPILSGERQKWIASWAAGLFAATSLESTALVALDPDAPADGHKSN